MTVAVAPAINAEAVTSRLDRLRGEYDPAVEREEATLDTEAFEVLLRNAREDYTGGGYAWVVREEPVELGPTMPNDVAEQYPRVLLGLGRGDDGWGPAGGGREPDETYEEAAVREVREETGVECEVVDCRRVRRTVFTPSDGSEPAVDTLWVFFVARDVGGSIDVLESELNGAAWFHEVPSDLKRSIEANPWDWDEWG